MSFSLCSQPHDNCCYIIIYTLRKFIKFIIVFLQPLFPEMLGINSIFKWIWCSQPDPWWQAFHFRFYFSLVHHLVDWSYLSSLHLFLQKWSINAYFLTFCMPENISHFVQFYHTGWTIWLCVKSWLKLLFSFRFLLTTKFLFVCFSSFEICAAKEE